MKKYSTGEIFCGTKSFSKVMKKHGHRTHTIDNDAQFDPDMKLNVLDMWPDHFGRVTEAVDILWCSPPCQGFSVAAIGHNWGGGRGAYKPISDSARLGIKLAKKTISIIEKSKPKIWFIENPRGVLRKMKFMDAFLKRTGGRRHTITYCQYGDSRMKPTDIWTNAHWWKPKSKCKNGAPCHVAAPRGSKTGTRGLAGAMERGRIPSKLFEEILKQMPKKI